MCSALPALHAFTGCDFNPAFYNKGKNKPFSILTKNTNYQEAFAKLHEFDENDTISNTLEAFVCELYATKKNKLNLIKTVNEARVQLFFQSYGKIDDMESFKKKVVNFDASMIPPCLRELQQHILRTKYIASLWMNARKENLSELLPEENGWVLTESNTYMFNWFEGDESPEKVQVILDKNTGDFFIIFSTYIFLFFK